MYRRLDSVTRLPVDENRSRTVNLTAQLHTTQIRDEMLLASDTKNFHCIITKHYQTYSAGQ